MAEQKKEMTVQEKNSVLLEDRKSVLKNIATMLNEGVDIKSKFTPEMMNPMNPVSNREYNGVNAFKLFLKSVEENLKDPRFVTFNQAQENGWKIKKGSKSILLEAWEFKDKAGKPHDIPIGKKFRVFNARDVEGMPELKLPERDKAKSMEKAAEVIDKINKNLVRKGQKPIILDKSLYGDNKEAYLADSLKAIVKNGIKDKTFTPSQKDFIADLGSIVLQSKLNIELHKNDAKELLRKKAGYLFSMDAIDDKGKFLNNGSKMFKELHNKMEFYSDNVVKELGKIQELEKKNGKDISEIPLPKTNGFFKNKGQTQENTKSGWGARMTKTKDTGIAD